MHSIKTISDLSEHLEPVILEADFNRVHEIFEKLADRYGKLFTVRFANQPLVVVADTECVNFVLRKRPDIFGPYHRKNRILEAMKVDGIEAADGPDWKRQREVMALSMESAFLVRYFESVKAVTEDLKRRWTHYGDQLAEADFQAEMFGFSISAFTAILFGDLANLPADEREAAENLLYNLVAVLSRRIDALLPQMHLESLSKDKTFDQEIWEIFSIIENIVAHNRKYLTTGTEIGEPANLVQALLAIMEHMGLDDRHGKLIENILLIILAAEPTTANTLLRTLHSIAANPIVQREIHAEVDALLGNGGIAANIEDTRKLKNIDAAIFETMRTSSVSRLAIVEAKEDVVLGSVKIPCGTPLVLLMAYCGLDETNFQRASEFDHRRWRSDSKTEVAQHNNKAFLGFGAGPRSCPGRGLAMLVMRTALGMIFGNFHLKPVLEKPFPLGFAVEIRHAKQ
jgi:cytochrome P450